MDILKSTVDSIVSDFQESGNKVWKSYNPYDLYSTADSLLISIEENCVCDIPQMRDYLIMTDKISDMLFIWSKNSDNVVFPPSLSRTFENFSQQTCPIDSFPSDVESRVTTLVKKNALILK